MMMNRERISFWVRLVAILLAVFFVGSFIFVGLGTNVSYNLFDLIGDSGKQQKQPKDNQQELIDLAQKEYKQNPKDPETITNLAAVYYQNGRLDDAARVLEKGREGAPKDVKIPLFLGQIRSQQAQATPEEKEKKDLYDKSGDAYAAATEIEPKNENAHLLAGEAYDKAGEPAQAIKYWNGYLELEPKGENATAVKSRISAMLEGKETKDGAQQ